MGAANRREAARTRGVSSISTVVSSLPSLGAGVRNYVHHVRFVPKQDSRTSPRGVPGIPRVTRSSPRRDASPSRRSLARSRRRAVPRVHGSIPRAADLPSFRRPVRRFASWSFLPFRVLVPRTRDVSSLSFLRVFVRAPALGKTRASSDVSLSSALLFRRSTVVHPRLRFRR